MKGKKQTQQRNTRASLAKEGRGVGFADQCFPGEEPQESAKKSSPGRRPAESVRKQSSQASGRLARFTDLTITRDNARHLVRGGRARWKIENETFNTMKN